MPSNQTTKEDPICIHGRDTWADDCGMCDASGTEIALSSLTVKVVVSPTESMGKDDSIDL